MDEHYQSRGFKQYQYRGDVDNQLGNLYGKYQEFLAERSIKIQESSEKPEDGFEFSQFSTDYPIVLKCKQAISPDIAQKVREFLSNIPFDPTCQVLNDTTNPPQNHVYNELDDFERVEKAYQNRINDPKEWGWERYHLSFWRAYPKTLEAFIGSPIPAFFSLFDQKWAQTSSENIDISSYYRGTWVIQRLQQDYGMAAHSDDNPNRKLSFLYYLTSDDWDYQKKGGALSIFQNNHQIKLTDHYIRINPEFNSMIAWDMSKHPSPIHFVEPVLTKKPRISLVGFFNND